MMEIKFMFWLSVISVILGMIALNVAAEFWRMNDSCVTKDQRQSQVLMEGSIPSTPASLPSEQRYITICK